MLDTFFDSIKDFVAQYDATDDNLAVKALEDFDAFSKPENFPALEEALRTHMLYDMDQEIVIFIEVLKTFYQLDKK